MSDLRECPCCGGEVIRDISKMKHGTVYSIYCDGCGLEIARLTEEEAVEAWNRRTI